MIRFLLIMVTRSHFLLAEDDACCQRVERSPSKSAWRGVFGAQPKSITKLKE